MDAALKNKIKKKKKKRKEKEKRRENAMEIKWNEGKRRMKIERKREMGRMGEWALAAVDKLQSDPAHPFVTKDARLELFFFVFFFCFQIEK